MNVYIVREINWFFLWKLGILHLQQYLTSKLSCFLLRSVDAYIKREIDENIAIKEEIDDDLLKEEEIDQEYDDLFDNMEVIRYAL